MTAVNLMALGVPPALAERLARRTIFVPASLGHAGATAGWVQNNDFSTARLPASQTNSTLHVPIPCLKLGDVIKSFKVVAQIESAGNTVTLNASLRRLTNAAGDPTDASLGAITQVQVTADTAVSSSHTLATEETFNTGEMVYLLVTATTGVSTDIQLLGVEVEVDGFGVTA